MRAIVGVLAAALAVAGCGSKLKVGFCEKDLDCPGGQFCSQEPSAAKWHRCFPVIPTDGGDAGVDVGPDAGRDTGADVKPDVPPACSPVCVAPKPVCDLKTLTCVGCLSTANCAAPTGVCDVDAATCVQCLSSGTCAADGGKPVCETASRACVGCLGDSDCKAATAPICNLTPHACSACATDEQCTAKDATKPACDMASGSCFPCVNSKKHCPTAAPICDANACRACKTDAECARDYGADPAVCVAGQCATNDQVIYLQNSASCSSTGGGTLAGPFCFSADASAALSAQKSILVVRGTIPTPLTISFAGSPVVVVGQAGAHFSGVASQPLVTVTAGDVTVRDMEISGGPGAGVSATGGTLRMTRCFVLNNTDGGIKTSNSAFDITNTVVAGNAPNTGAVAVTLGTYTGPGPTRFAFSTVVNNTGTGVYCGQPYTLAGMLVNGNQALNLSPMCAIDATSSTDPPQFDPTRPYHLVATSPCRDKAGTANLPPDDIDGDTRPQPAGGAGDCGADEFVSP